MSGPWREFTSGCWSRCLVDGPVNRLDLAVLLFDLAPSGVVRNALRIAKASSEAGLNVEIWAARADGEMRALVPSDIALRTLGLEIGANYSRAQRKRASLSAASALEGLLSAHRPRILLSAGNHVHPLAVKAFQRSNAVGTRLIGRVSNALPRFSRSPLLIGPSLYKRLQARRRYRAMHRLIAVSEGLRTDLVNDLGIEPEKIDVIANGVDLDEVERKAGEPIDHPWFSAGGPPVVVGVGRLVAQKDFATLIRAFANARKSMPMRLMILGSGPQQSMLAALAVRLGISGDVDLPGHIANPFPYLKRASLFVLPSRWEGMSNALLEALASGCPAVATRCSGSVEILQEGEWGTLVPVAREDALASAIVETLRKPPARESQLRRAADYSLAVTMSRYVQIFRDEILLGARSGD